MSATGLEVFDSTLQETNSWLNGISEQLGFGDRHTAYRAMRGSLHALRDSLTVDEAAHLAAQLPMLVRGIYFEGWDPSRVPKRVHDRDVFLQRVGEAFQGAEPVNPELACRAVFRVLVGHISPGQAEDVRNMLPSDVRALWP